MKVNPASYNLSPALQQFYSTLTSHIVGESQQLCLMAVQVSAGVMTVCNFIL